MNYSLRQKLSASPLLHTLLGLVSLLGSSYDGDLSLPLGLALGSPIFPSGCEGKLGVARRTLGLYGPNGLRLRPLS